MTKETPSSHLLDSTCARFSRKLNQLRGASPHLTICEEEWERRLDGCLKARVNVAILDFLFLVLKNDKHHCARDWQKRRSK